MRNRQWRRAQRERKIAAVTAWVKDYWSDDQPGMVIHAKKRARSPQLCSNYCCGNPRKWFGSRTQQELKVTPYENE